MNQAFNFDKVREAAVNTHRTNKTAFKIDYSYLDDKKDQEKLKPNIEPFKAPVEDTKMDTRELDYEKEMIQWKKDRIKNTFSNITKAKAKVPGILKGLSSGEAPELLFLEAMEALSIALDKPEILDQVQKTAMEINGRILGNQVYQIKDLEEQLDYIVKLQGAVNKEKDPKEKARLKSVLSQYEQKFKEIEKQVNS